jgi:hypothetical protein
MRHIFFMFALIAVVVMVAACSSSPFVHKPDQYDRSAKGFGQPVKDISEVTICYSAYGTQPRQVSQLAVDECAAFNKTAKFVKQSYNVCPMATPIAAIYECQSDGNLVTGGILDRDGQSNPGGTLINYDGIEFRY